MITITQQSGHTITVNHAPILNLQDLHNVVITNPQNGDVLKYNSTTGIWYDVQP